MSPTWAGRGERREAPLARGAQHRVPSPPSRPRACLSPTLPALLRWPSHPARPAWIPPNPSAAVGAGPCLAIRVCSGPELSRQRASRSLPQSSPQPRGPIATVRGKSWGSGKCSYRPQGLASPHLGH